MNRRWIFTSVIFSILSLSSCGEGEKGLPEKAPTVSGVETEAVTLTSMAETYEAVGTVRSKTTTVLSSRIMSHLSALRVREGDRVKAGQLLIELDDREGTTRLRKAEAGLREAEQALQEVERNTQAMESARKAAEAENELAQSTFKRYQALLERGSVSRQEFEEIQAKRRAKGAEVDRLQENIQSLFARKKQVLARIDQAQAEVADAKLFLNYSRIHSPITGKVVTKHVEIGDLALPGNPLLTLEDPDHYRLEAAVEESKVAFVRIGEVVEVFIDSLGPEPWAGRVAEIAPLADPATRSATVKIDLVGNRKESRLRSGLYGRARFPLGKGNILTIPQKAILRHGQLTEVFLVEKNIARLRLIKTGKIFGTRVEVLAGLREGDRIVVKGVEKVRDGYEVKKERD